MEDNGGIGGAMRWPLLLSLPSGGQVWWVGRTLHTHPSRKSWNGIGSAEAWRRSRWRSGPLLPFGNARADCWADMLQTCTANGAEMCRALQLAKASTICLQKGPCKPPHLSCFWRMVLQAMWPQKDRDPRLGWGRYFVPKNCASQGTLRN